MTFIPFPNLTTERLFLRQIHPKDAQDIFVLRSDDRIMKYLDRPPARTLEDARHWIAICEDQLQATTGITWGVTRPPANTVIGTIGYWRIIPEHFRAEIGYLLHPEYQGYGLMQEAFTCVRAYGVDTLRLHSIEANVNPQNAASIRFLERNHFRREAYFHENYYYHGKFLDTVVYSLIHQYDSHGEEEACLTSA